MKVAQINMTNDTKFAILKGVSRHSDLRNFQKAITKYGFELDEYQLSEITYELARNDATCVPMVRDTYIIQ